MTFQLIIFFYMYLFLLLVWLAFSAVALYHMFKYAFRSFASYFAIGSYLVVSFIILTISFFYISGIDWSQKITIRGFGFKADYQENDLRF